MELSVTLGVPRKIFPNAYFGRKIEKLRVAFSVEFTEKVEFVFEIIFFFRFSTLKDEKL